MSRQSPQGIVWGSLPYQLEGDFVFLVLLSVQQALARYGEHVGVMVPAWRLQAFLGDPSTRSAWYDSSAEEQHEPRWSVKRNCNDCNNCNGKCASSCPLSF